MFLKIKYGLTSYWPGKRGFRRKSSAKIQPHDLKKDKKIKSATPYQKAAKILHENLNQALFSLHNYIMAVKAVNLENQPNQ